MKITRERIKEIIREEITARNIDNMTEGLDQDIEMAQSYIRPDYPFRARGIDALERLKNLDSGDLDFFKRKLRHRASLPDDAPVEDVRIEPAEVGFQVMFKSGGEQQVVSFDGSRRPKRVDMQRGTGPVGGYRGAAPAGRVGPNIPRGPF